MADFATDTFTGADATDLAAHTPELGGSWTELYAGQLTLLSNQLDGPTAGDAYAVINATPPSADYAVEADVVVLIAGYPNLAGVLGRYTFTGPNGYLGYFDVGATTWKLAKYVAGAYTLLASYSDPTFSTGTKRVALEMTGTALVLKVDGVTRCTAIDASISAANKAGVICEQGYSTVAHLDNFRAGAPTVSGAHAVSGRGTFSIAGLEWLKVATSGIPGTVSRGTAEPTNYFHMGILTWQTVNGAMLAYPITRSLELIKLPPNMTSIGYYLVSPITATITELPSP
jgi:hypothetical protein